MKNTSSSDSIMRDWKAARRNARARVWRAITRLWKAIDDPALIHMPEKKGGVTIWSGKITAKLTSRVNELIESCLQYDDSPDGLLRIVAQHWQRRTTGGANHYDGEMLLNQALLYMLTEGKWVGRDESAMPSKRNKRIRDLYDNWIRRDTGESMAMRQIEKLLNLPHNVVSRIVRPRKKNPALPKKPR